MEKNPDMTNPRYNKHIFQFLGFVAGWPVPLYRCKITLLSTRLDRIVTFSDLILLKDPFRVEI